MAKSARSAPVRASSTGIDASSSLPVPTRRGLLAIAAGAAAAASTALPATASIPVRRWDRLRVQFEAARDAMQLFEDTSYRPAADYIEKVTGKVPASHVEITWWHQPRSVWIHDPIPQHDAYDPVRKAKADYDAWRQRFGEAERAVNFEPIDKRMSELDKEEYDARDRLIDEPAPDLPALAYKLKLALEPEELRPDHRDALRLDSERLVR